MEKHKQISLLSSTITNKNNAIIISYWGKTIPERARWGNVVSTYHRIGNFGTDKIYDDKALLEEIYEMLTYGEKVLGFTPLIDDATEKIIADLLLVVKKSTNPTTFYYTELLELLRKYTMALGKIDRKIFLLKSFKTINI